jgi:glycosyltransferase involved in cell wall biosynthesis
LSHIKADPPDIVVFLDADLADDPAQVPRLVQPILNGESDFVLGQRRALAEPGALDPHQRLGNAMACTVLRCTTGFRYRDLGPLRAIRWRSLEQLAMVDQTWGWTLEMQYKAVKQGLRISQIDVPYRKRHRGKSKISGSIKGSFKAGVVIFSTLAKLWWTSSQPVDRKTAVGEV